MENVCRSIAQMKLAAGSSLLLPQHTGQLIGVLYFRSGSGTLTGTAVRPLSMRAGSAAVYPARYPHRVTAQTDASVLLCTFTAPRSGTVPAHLTELQLPWLNELARTMEDVLDTACGDGLPELLLEAPEAEDADIPIYVRSARKIMDDHYDEDLTLDELSARVGRSKFHLSRAFRDSYRTTPGAYLTAVRLARAEELLTDTELPVREIGRKVGFSNSAYFTTLFKQHYGCPPNEFRLLVQNSEKD